VGARNERSAAEAQPEGNYGADVWALQGEAGNYRLQQDREIETAARSENGKV